MSNLMISDELCYDECDDYDETDEERLDREQVILEQNWLNDDEAENERREMDELNLEYGAR